ncbi:L-seryl-tRNA(Sec) selenium transferase [Geobacter pelophilus]|uniref:L-seryl-tRNA(Sec) selenium transferase n=1 Tax=Geoanaerobacter pelophilus TaxID=60036 RepID=A0AAW4KZ36_9BACT|nr:L-seryl-tRNA(Sec) selenium transferase [Geoanaerobacter pelophilus]MBT0663644.1 L-seryl-tRNA(Sec) selenium transferase [Geoanaerobacter pelophilus]
MAKELSRIPKVDKLLTWPPIISLLVDHPRPLVMQAIRGTLDRLRLDSVNGVLPHNINEEQLASLVQEELGRLSASSLRPVINGTGVVIHTNLGRSLLSRSACEQIAAVAGRYSNLEIDIETGERGERYSHVESLLCELTGAEAAIVVNNNAAAVLLALSGMAAGREVVVSRGELVEIGGAFRIPDVMRQSGGILREVGATNRTHLKDYQAALSAETALLLKVHTSNFAVVGFTAEVTVAGLVDLGRRHGIPVMADIGSGSLLDLAPYGVLGETTISDYVSSGADIITCSGDKMLGGPQAGIILGKKPIMDKLRRHPLLRAIRIDKLTLAGLEATLRLYRDERQALAEIPTLRMLTSQPAELRKRGQSWLRRLRGKIPSSVALSLHEGSSQVGGGALPLLNLPTWLIAVTAEHLSAQQIDQSLRKGRVPVLGRIYRDRYLLDLRTLQDEDFPHLIEALQLLVEPPNGQR